MSERIVLFCDGLLPEIFSSISKHHEIQYVLTSNKDLNVDFDTQNANKIEVFNPELKYDFSDSICVLFLFKKIIDTRNIVCKGIYNFHFGVLPEWRGNSCNVWSIINGDRSIGYSFHEVNNFVDDGRILYRYIVELTKGQKYTDVRESIIQHSIMNAPILLSRVFRLESINVPCSGIKYTPRSRYLDTVVGPKEIKVNIFYGLYYAFGGSDWGFTLKTLIGDFEIISVHEEPVYKEVFGFAGRVVNYVHHNEQLYTQLKVIDGYVFIGKVKYKGEIIDLHSIVKIGAQL